MLGYFSILLDLIFMPLTILASMWFRTIKFIGLKKFRLANYIFNIVGVFPIVKHYYEPQYDFGRYKQRYRDLTAIEYKDSTQLEELKSLNYQK